MAPICTIHQRRFEVECAPLLLTLTLPTEFLKSDPSRDDAKSTAASSSENKPLIPKPPGEVTRRTRGGYALEKELNWNADLYKDVQVKLTSLTNVALELTPTKKRVHELATEHLYLHGTFPTQDKVKLQIVYAEARKSFPILNEYRGDWVVEDFLRVYLKRTKTRRNGGGNT